MKKILIIIFSLILFLNLSAQNLKDIKLKTNSSTVTLEQALKYIEQNTKFNFTYNKELIPLEKNIQFKDSEESLYQVLYNIAKNCGLIFNRIGNQIVVRKTIGNENFSVDEKETYSAEKERGILRGFVSDSLSGEPLPYANVYIKEYSRGTTTDFRGYFLIASLPSSKFIVTVSYVGYRTKQIEAETESGKVGNIKVLLSSTNIQMKTIETNAQRISSENAPDVSLNRITAHDIEIQPKGVEADIFRTIQSLPGVQSGGDVSGRFFVRGSASNENLILLDNVPIYNPYHALSILSAIDPDLISSVEFYKGGFPVEYTGRLSSVLKINTKNGNQNFASGKAALSLLTAKLFLEGPLPSGSFLIGGRKNYSDAVLKKFKNDNSVPADFFDVFAKINIADDDFIKGARISLSAFSSGDKIMFDNPLLEDYKWSNNTANFNFFQLSDTPLFYQINISASTFGGEITPNQSGSKYLKNEFREYTMHADFNYVYESKDELSGGIRISDVYSNQILSNLLGLQSNIELKGTSLSAFIKYQLLRYSFMGMDFGVRGHATRLAGGGPSFFIEPRANFTFRMIPEIAFKGSWGLYMQDLVTISDENETVLIFEPWIITPKYLTPSNAIHYITGFEITPSENLSFNVEGYYKIMHSLAIVNDKKYLTTDPDLISGSGEAYGIEFQTKYHLLLFDLTASYSWMKSSRTVNKVTYPPRYDSRHNINFTLSAGLSSGWTATAVWTYYTGLPFTQITGYYNKLTPIQIGDNPFLINSYTQYAMLGPTNVARLPDYHRLDISITKKFQIDNLKISLDLSVLNVYDRKNLFYFKRSNGERVNMLPIFPSINIKAEL